MDITTQLIEAERIVCRIEKDPEVALELYQDLCLTCLENGDVDWSRSQVGRIVRIVQRLRVTRFRRTAVRQSQCIDRIGPDECVASTIHEECDEETRQLLFDAIRRLPENLRRAIEQKYVREEPDDSLAVEMDVDVATVRKWRSRGINAMRDDLYRCGVNPDHRVGGSV